jgi:RNA polymerase sigma-70 factor (ECF subfamily)
MPQAPTSESELDATFAALRPRLRGIAYRLLGSHWDAEDAVQEAWLRLQRADLAKIDNLEAWLTVVISRVSVDQLRARGARHEDVGADVPDHDPGPEPTGPEDDAVRAEELGTAMMIVLDTLGPLDRLAFVLHDVFGLPFDEIAPIIERTPAAARQLASRARRRVREVDLAAERGRRHHAVGAFLKAARSGDFGALLQLLDPEVELRADAEVIATAAPYADSGAPLLQARVRGADAVARVFAGRADLALPALIDGFPGVVYAPDGSPVAVYAIRIRDGKIIAVEAIGRTDHLADLKIDFPEP